MQDFRKFAVLFLEILRHEIHLFLRERLIAFQSLPPEFVFDDAKITFLLSKMVFLTYNCTSCIFQSFSTKRKIFMSLIFHDISFEK